MALIIHHRFALALLCAAVTLPFVSGCSSPQAVAAERLKARVKPIRQALEREYGGGGRYQPPPDGPKLVFDEPNMAKGDAEGSFTAVAAWTATFNPELSEGEIQAHKAFFTYKASEGIWRLDHLEHRMVTNPKRRNFPYEDMFLWKSTLRRQQPTGEGTVDSPLTFSTTRDELAKIYETTSISPIKKELLDDTISAK